MSWTEFSSTVEPNLSYIYPGFFSVYVFNRGQETEAVATGNGETLTDQFMSWNQHWKYSSTEIMTAFSEQNLESSASKSNFHYFFHDSEIGHFFPRFYKYIYNSPISLMATGGHLLHFWQLNAVTEPQKTPKPTEL